MFKKYRMEWEEDDGKHSVDFFVNSKPKRNGFLHRSCVIGMLPRLDATAENWAEYKANEEKLFSSRMTKVSYLNRTWECYGGQTCLAKLWDRLAKLKFLDMGRISASNPFNGVEEPEHEDLIEPDELFDRFRKEF